MKPDLPKLRREYRRLQKQLTAIAWISHGYVQNRGPGAGGPCYQWTRKEHNKTISVALSREQYLGMKTAVANWRTAQQTLRRMEQISRTVLFATLPEPPRRKSLSPKVLGLN